jgi:glycosyltransferase involved in cell wall biosynthesis
VAFVQHSVTASDGDCEGTPVAVLEAGAAALPVIATAHTGIAEVIIHNETGFLVKEQDVETMAKYMIYLLENSATAAAMGIKARERIQTHFNIAKHIATINKTIEKTVQ